MTGWCRLAATSILFFALAAGPAAAAGGAGIGQPSASSTPTSDTIVTTTTTSTSTPTAISTTSTKTSTKSSTTVTSSMLSRVLGSRMLKLGMQGTDVTVLQRDLSALDYAIPATGVFNRPTLRRLKQFQHRYRLTVDGVAGPTTITELKKLLSSRRHFAESAVAAKELASGAAVTATSSDEPLPAGDTGLTGGVGLGGTDATGTQSSSEIDATLTAGLASAAEGTPQAIVNMIEAGNAIAFDPYIYGGGHASFNAKGYDCSGSVSYVLHAAGLLASPLDSEQFLHYGLPGKGNWITIYTNGPTHVYIEIAGLWFDTAAQTALNGNDRWSLTRIAEPGYGHFVARHPSGW